MLAGNWKEHGHGNATNTPSRDKLVAFIHERHKATGAYPTTEECRAHMGWKAVGSVLDCLRRCRTVGALAEEIANAMIELHYHGKAAAKPRGMRREDWLAMQAKQPG